MGTGDTCTDRHDNFLPSHCTTASAAASSVPLSFFFIDTFFLNFSAASYQECNPGHELLPDGICRPYTCKLGDGTECRECRDLKFRTADHQCTACNDNFTLTDGVCAPSPCVSGEGAACDLVC